MTANADDVFFRFGAFDEEIARKQAAGKAPSATLLDRLLASLAAGGRKRDLQRIGAVGQALPGVSFQHGGPTYLNHPIRVAASLAAYLPQIEDDTIVLALVHNLFEQTADAGSLAVEPLVGPAVLASVRRLTIDRARERDPRYLAAYYDGVCAGGRQLVVTKALDKLDNLLGWTTKVVQPFYYDVICHHVCPMLGKEDAKLRDYIETLVPMVRDRAFA